MYNKQYYKTHKENYRQYYLAHRDDILNRAKEKHAANIRVMDSKDKMRAASEITHTSDMYIYKLFMTDSTYDMFYDWINGMDYKEIAKKYNIPCQAVDRRFKRAFNKMSRKVKPRWC